MRSPVRFQSLERELEPVLPYLKGAVLNAGCGGRDVTPLLVRNGAARVTNCDLDPKIPGAIRCDLSAIPLADASFDAVLCNAVLEHVQLPQRVVSELRRLTRPGGVLVLGVPFLQPYHPHPTDFRRYTREGLVEIAREHDLEVVDLLPTDSLAQTVGAIVWFALHDKQKRWLRALLWLPIFLWTSLSRRTDFDLRLHANGYQAVMRRPAVAPSGGAQRAARAASTRDAPGGRHIVSLHAW